MSCCDRVYRTVTTRIRALFRGTEIDARLEMIKFGTPDHSCRLGPRRLFGKLRVPQNK
jgi:hypothetical protein